MNNISPLIALTGATGFIGGNLCRHLLVSGFRVRILVRNSARAEALQHLGAEVVEGHLHNADALANLVANTAAVIHCAGGVRGRILGDFTEPNVEGTRNLITALDAMATPAKLLLMSSLAAREPGLSHYANSKRLAETLVEGRANTLVLRPPPVYGSGDKEMLPLFRMMSRGITVIPGALSSRVSLVYIDDLVSAVIAWVNSSTSIEGTYTLSDPRAGGYSWHDIVAIASRVFGRPVRAVSLPLGVVNGVASSNVLISKWLGYLPMLTPEKLRELRHPDWTCDFTALASVLNWQPQTDFQTGLPLALSASPK